MARDPFMSRLYSCTCKSCKNGLQSANLRVNFAENVKEEWLHVKVECLVVQEQLGEEAEVLAVKLVHFPVGFPDGESPFAVDFLARGLAAITLTQVVPAQSSLG